MASETTISVNIGDNTREVIAETSRIASEAAQLSVIAAFNKLDQDFLIPVERRCHDIVAALDYFETTLINEVRPQ